jgi:hypothetical protein
MLHHLLCVFLFLKLSTSNFCVLLQAQSTSHLAFHSIPPLHQFSPFHLLTATHAHRLLPFPHNSSHMSSLYGSSLSFILGSTVTAAYFFSPHLPLASAITAVVPRRRDADVSAAGRRAGSPNRDGNLRAGSGPPFRSRPPSLSVFSCPAPSFLPSLASGFMSKTQNLYKKHKIKKAQKSVFQFFFWFARLFTFLPLPNVPCLSVGAVIHQTSASLTTISSNASEHYVRAWAPRVRGRALAEGEITCLRCSMSQRVSDRLMYVSSLVLHVLSGFCGFIVIVDNHSPLSQSR